MLLHSEFSPTGGLTVSPRFGPMLGGQYLVIGGPCVEATATIKIKFAGFTLKYTCEWRTEFSVICITPSFSYTGDVPIIVDIEDQGNTAAYRGLYTICK
jgi:hypothetical protein